MGGSNTPGANGGQPGVYGTQGTPAAANIPGSRSSAVALTDTNGNLWLFAGFGYDAVNGQFPAQLGELDDLWNYNPASGQWTWIDGSNIFSSTSQTGLYGTLGDFAVGFVPGDRNGGVGWMDGNGDLWLFSGWSSVAFPTGSDVTTQSINDPSNCCYNDLWEFKLSSNLSAWVGGSLKFNQTGIYGTLGTPAASNIPGGREGAVSWTDHAGNFWLFGGYGFDANGTLCYLNDLWKFDPATGAWGWMSGSSTAAAQSGLCQSGGQPGVYGALGATASGNTPGGRAGQVGWTDSGGNLWLFGGYGADSAGAVGYLNDFWRFNPSTSEWTWMGGSSTLGGFGGVPGIYRTWMTPASGNFPGSRQAATSWTDGNGNLWLFGGLGYDSVGAYGFLNDLWEFNPSSGEWAWMGGSMTQSALATPPGVYGTLQSPGFLNIPSGREGAAGWTDSKGNLWLFGGYSPAYSPASGLFDQSGYYNDLWEFQPSPASQPATAQPSFSPEAGAYPAGEMVAISDATSGATIYYFTSGSASATEYTGPLGITSTGTIQAIAVAPGHANSAVASATFTVAITASPTFSVAPGTYDGTQTVKLSSATPGAIIYYALNAAPTGTSTTYSAPLTVSSSETIQAFAIAPGFSPSATASASYTIWPTSAANQWAWMGGSNTTTQAATPVYGTLGVPSTENIPGFRQFSATWIDQSGNLWFFGGLGIDANLNNFSHMNDLWKFSPSTNQWTWMGGSQTVGSPAVCREGVCGQPGVYGTLGTPAAANIPGGREGPASWTDAEGDFWMFGGYGYDLAGNPVFLNDLWEYNPTTSEWAWMGGPNEVTVPCTFYCGGEPGVYGTLGTPGSANIPGGRYQPTSWTDSQGNFWLFGGEAFDPSNIITDDFNDLWKFSPSTKEWTWIGGDNWAKRPACSAENPNTLISTFGDCGVYGTWGSPSSNDMPGSRRAATGWVDQTGNLWLAGGNGFDAYGGYNPLNDVWKFSPSSNQWTWMGGSSTVLLGLANWNSTGGGPGQLPIYGSAGAQGVPVAGNIPLFFAGAANWIDKKGNFWLFGGASGDAGGGVNDLWEFSPSANEWAWMGGGGDASLSANDVSGTYGALGIPAPGNFPGARTGALSWTDNNGNFWMFGGCTLVLMYDCVNDLWEYQPSAPAPVPSFAVVAAAIPGTTFGTLNLPAGTSGTITVQTVVADGFNSSVNLAAGNLPTGVTATFSPASISGNGSSHTKLHS